MVQQVLDFPRYEYLCLRKTGVAPKKIGELDNFGTDGGLEGWFIWLPMDC